MYSRQVAATTGVQINDLLAVWFDSGEARNLWWVSSTILDDATYCLARSAHGSRDLPNADTAFMQLENQGALALTNHLMPPALMRVL
jgi:hypothetical protein